MLHDSEIPDPLPVGMLIGQFADPELRESIVSADVVVGIDVRDPTHKSLFFGQSTINRIAENGDDNEDATMIEIPIDFATDDVEALCAFCVTQKGSCCYRNEKRIDPRFN